MKKNTCLIICLFIFACGTKGAASSTETKLMSAADQKMISALNEKNISRLKASFNEGANVNLYFHINHPQGLKSDHATKFNPLRHAIKQFWLEGAVMIINTQPIIPDEKNEFFLLSDFLYAAAEEVENGIGPVEESHITFILEAIMGAGISARDSLPRGRIFKDAFDHAQACVECDSRFKKIYALLEAAENKIHPIAQSSTAAAPSHATDNNALQTALAQLTAQFNQFATEMRAGLATLNTHVDAHLDAVNVRIEHLESHVSSLQLQRVDINSTTALMSHMHTHSAMQPGNPEEELPPRQVTN